MQKIKKYLPIVVLAVAIFLPIIAHGQVLNNLGDFRVEAGLPNVDLVTFIARLVRIFLSLTAVIVVLVIILAGFRWMLAGADEEKRAKARGALVSAIVGLVIIFASFAIASFVINLLANATA